MYMTVVYNIDIVIYDVVVCTCMLSKIVVSNFIIYVGLIDLNELVFGYAETVCMYGYYYIVTVACSANFPLYITTP